MSKPNKTAGSVDIHEMTRAEAIAARHHRRVVNSSDLPLTNDLIDAAAAAMRRALPASFMFKGRRYYLKTSIGLARLEVFDKPAAADPMITAITGSMASSGHEQRQSVGKGERDGL